MGLIGNLLNSANDALENAHASRLEQCWFDALHRLDGMNDRVRFAAMSGFLAGRRELLTEIPNWSVEGRLRAARELQEEARRCFDFNISKSWASFVVGAWLEGQARSFERSRNVYRRIEEFARSLEDDEAPKVVNAGLDEKIDGKTTINNQPEVRRLIADVPAASRVVNTRRFDPQHAAEEVQRLFGEFFIAFKYSGSGAMDSERWSVCADYLQLCNEVEREYMAAVLFGIWHSLIIDYGKFSGAERIVRSSLVQWLSVDQDHALNLVRSLINGTASPEAIEAARLTSSEVTQFFRDGSITHFENISNEVHGYLGYS